MGLEWGTCPPCGYPLAFTVRRLSVADKAQLDVPTRRLRPLHLPPPVVDIRGFPSRCKLDRCISNISITTSRDLFPLSAHPAQADLKKQAPEIFKWILEVVSAGPGVPILHRVASCTLTRFWFARCITAGRNLTGFCEICWRWW